MFINSQGVQANQGSNPLFANTTSNVGFQQANTSLLSPSGRSVGDQFMSASSLQGLNQASAQVASPATASDLVFSLMGTVMSLMTSMLGLLNGLVASGNQNQGAALPDSNFSSNPSSNPSSDTLSTDNNSDDTSATDDGGNDDVVDTTDTDTTSESNSSDTPVRSQGLANPNAPNNPLVVIEGDSLSTGTGGNFSYADQLSNRLDDTYKFSKQATGGDTVRRDILGDVDTINGLYSDDNQDNVVVLWGGTNDLHGGASGQDTYNKLAEAAQQYKDRGYKVLVLTSIQLGGSQDSSSKDAERLDFNNRIRNGSNAPWDGVVDVANLPEFLDTDNSVTENRDVYASDGVHLNTGGYRIISEQVEQALANLLG